MISTDEFAARRKKLLDQLDPESGAILFSSSEFIRNGDVVFPFRQGSDFYYFTGFSEPDAVAFFLPQRMEGEYILFNRAHDPHMERWVGPRTGQEGACEIYKADQAFDINQLDEKIIDLLRDRRTLFYELGKNSKWDRCLSRWVSKLQAANRKAPHYPSQLADIALISAEMRVIKSQSEVAALQKAADISAAAHCKIMEACRPGLFEFELEALFEYEIKRKGCRSTAYPSIVGGGGNGCILHYVENNDQLKDGDLLLVDAGAEWKNYAADITRTFPVNGRFSPVQAALYQVVLDTQLKVIEAVKPGISWEQLQQIAVECLTRGMIKLGVLSGTLKEAVEKKSYQQYFMHTIGHWLGLDVHDAGAYRIQGKWRPLEEGMVLTVEPGLYLSPHPALDAKWWHIGIRIEDDVLVTKNGCKVLTANVPKTIAEIEKIMSNKTVT